MKLLDTDILLEFFSGDEEKIEQIDSLFKELERKKEKLFITEEVIIELIYYLEQVYGWEREVVADVVNTVLLDSLFSVENRETIQRAVSLHRSSKLTFLDALKVAKAKKKKVKEVLSFNKKFEKVGLRLKRP